MDRTTQYQTPIETTLIDYYRLASKAPAPTVETTLVFDRQRQHYLLLNLGWKKDKRIKITTLHIRLVSSKIWIEEDWTEEGVATDLLRAGVSKEDIVLAFHSLHLRHHTEFAAVVR